MHKRIGGKAARGWHRTKDLPLPHHAVYELLERRQLPLVNQVELLSGRRGRQESEAHRHAQQACQRSPAALPAYALPQPHQGEEHEVAEAGVEVRLQLQLLNLPAPPVPETVSPESLGQPNHQLLPAQPKQGTPGHRPSKGRPGT